MGVVGSLSCPFRTPLGRSFVRDVVRVRFGSGSAGYLRGLYGRIDVLFGGRPSCLAFLETVSKFRIGKLQLFDLSVPRPSIGGLFTMGRFCEGGSSFVGPSLRRQLIVKSSDVSVFACSVGDGFFRVESGVNARGVFDSFDSFSSFLGRVVSDYSWWSGKGGGRYGPYRLFESCRRGVPYSGFDDTDCKGACGKAALLG